MRSAVVDGQVIWANSSGSTLMPGDRIAWQIRDTSVIDTCSDSLQVARDAWHTAVFDLPATQFPAPDSGGRSSVPGKEPASPLLRGAWVGAD